MRTIGKKLYDDSQFGTTELKKDRIVISDFDMPFWSIVKLMIKIAIASIPAGIILAIFYGLIISFLKA